MKALITIIACALLTGCVTSPRVIDLTSKPANKTVTSVGADGKKSTTTTTFDFTR